MVRITENPPTLSYVSSISEAQALVRRCAEPRTAGDQVKAAILRSSRRLGFPFNRTKDIWYGDARRIDAAEMDRLRRGDRARRTRPRCRRDRGTQEHNADCPLAGCSTSNFRA